jgi:3D (Asp-Asp-Asp) domain-containing protein
MLRKRSFRLAIKNSKLRKIILFTVLFGAMSLVGAVSYTGASEANQKYIEAENNKLRILEEQFNIAKNQEEIEKMEDLKAKEAAERAVEQARIAKEREAQRLAEEAAQLAITKAEKNILVSKTIKVPTKSPTSTPTKTTTTTTTNTTPVNPEPSMKYLGALSSTAYTHTGNNMANGEKPYEGAVACNLVPIGTKIYIEGYGYFVVKDRIGHGSQLDIFMDTYDECIQFGRRTLQVYVVN